MLSIREAHLDDARRIAEINVRSWQQAYRGIVPGAFLAGLSVEEREARWRRALTRRERMVIVAEDRGTVVGWAAGGASRDRDASPDSAEVYAIYVDPAAWRQGVGRLLMQGADERFRRLGYGWVTLWVLAENAAARSFYAALGFSRDASGVKTIELGGRDLIGLRYARELVGPAAGRRARR